MHCLHFVQFIQLAEFCGVHVLESCVYVLVSFVHEQLPWCWQTHKYDNMYGRYDTSLAGSHHIMVAFIFRTGMHFNSVCTVYQ